ncbi:MAG: polysaccharide biosynthesis/export family protein [Phycisphaerae bacterium]|nr:polysaccharide biosynthesis/export family protein [Phycisphaerae bacterium]
MTKPNEKFHKWSTCETIIAVAILGTVVVPATMVLSADVEKNGQIQVPTCKSPAQLSVAPLVRPTGDIDPSQELTPNAEFPRDDDAIYSPEDYRIGPSDILDISISLRPSNRSLTKISREVSRNGGIYLPLLEAKLNVEGMTKEQAIEAIVKAYDAANINANANVSVTITKHPRTFSAMGAVAKPGSFHVTRPNMRLLEAIAKAGGITQANIRYIYVIRSSLIKAKESPAGPEGSKLSSLPRVITIDLTKLRTGDPRMNIIVRDKDIIQVPMPRPSTSKETEG